jgi:hypothetical protein
MEEMSISRTAGTVSDPTTKPVVKPSEIRRRRCISPCLPQLSHRSPLLCIATQPDKPAAASRITTTSLQDVLRKNKASNSKTTLH